MASTVPLKGDDLIDCANANNKETIEVVAQLCGYGNDIEGFEEELLRSAEHIGLKIHSFYDLVKVASGESIAEIGIEIAPDSDQVF